jgi:hypothetical protein
MGGEECMYRHLVGEGITGDIIGRTPLDKECGYINEQYPDGSRGHRGIEIETWLQNPGFPVEQFVILDDDLAWFATMYGRHDSYVMKNLVHIQAGWATGIRDEHVEEAIEILNKS